MNKSSILSVFVLVGVWFALAIDAKENQAETRKVDEAAQHLQKISEPVKPNSFDYDNALNYFFERI